MDGPKIGGSSCKLKRASVGVRIMAQTSATLTAPRRPAHGCYRSRPEFASAYRSILVVHGLGETPLLLPSDEPIARRYKSLWHMLRACLKRWSIGETIRYAKTRYELENVRVLNYQGLQNLMPLVLAATFFAACVLDHDSRLQVMAGYVERAAKRVFGIPDFKYYALADGMRALFSRHPGPPVTRIHDTTPSQMPLFAFDPS